MARAHTAGSQTCIARGCAGARRYWRNGAETTRRAGRRIGRVTEDELLCGQEFNNTYEQTKCAAEALIREHMARPAPLPR